MRISFTQVVWQFRQGLDHARVPISTYQANLARALCPPKQDYLASSLRENAQRSVALTNYLLEEASFSAYPNSSRARHQ
jgi:hypothetical protein